MKKKSHSKAVPVSASPAQYIFSTRKKKTIRYRFPTHTNRLVMDRSQAEAAEAFMVVLEPKQAPPLHVHDDTEQIFYVVRGAGTLYIGASAGAAQRFRVKTGDLVRIPPHTLHRIRPSGKKRLVYLSVDCFPGGRPKDEPTWESHVRAVCQLNGWDFDKTRT
jgi:mannose-6-phosphate isomerase-like protein (cupin superfamily)